MVKIRLMRCGTKKRPFYQVVVTDSRKSIQGKFISCLGYLDILSKKQEEKQKICLNEVRYWIEKGAQPSIRVKKIIKDVSTN